MLSDRRYSDRGSSMDEASRAQRNNRGVGRGFYTIAEAAKVLGVGQRRILEMVETKELEGERDPTSSRWKISSTLYMSSLLKSPWILSSHYSLRMHQSLRKTLWSCKSLRRGKALRRSQVLRSHYSPTTLLEKSEQKGSQDSPKSTYGSA